MYLFFQSNADMISDQQTIPGQDETVLFDQSRAQSRGYRYCQYAVSLLSPSRQPQSHLTSQLNIINEANINEVFSDLTNAEDLKICLKLT